MDDQNPHLLFTLSFAISAIAGLAAILRSGKDLSTRSTLSAVLNSGLFGLGIAFVWFEYSGGRNHPWFMLGVSLLAGLGGTNLMEFFFQALREFLRLYAIRGANVAPFPFDDPNAPRPPYQPPAPNPYNPYNPPSPDPYRPNNPWIQNDQTNDPAASQSHPLGLPVTPQPQPPPGVIDPGPPGIL